MREQLRFILHGAEVRRFHTFRTIEPETVGEHSFFVAWFCWLLSEGKLRSELLLAALAHDLAEQEVGDMPSPAKRALGVGADVNALEERFLKQAGLHFEITEEERRILKRADCLAGLSACVRERRLGHRHIAKVFRRYRGYLDELHAEYPCGITAFLITELTTLWHEEHTI